MDISNFELFPIIHRKKRYLLNVRFFLILRIFGSLTVKSFFAFVPFFINSFEIPHLPFPVLIEKAFFGNDIMKYSSLLSY